MGNELTSDFSSLGSEKEKVDKDVIMEDKPIDKDVVMKDEVKLDILEGKANLVVKTNKKIETGVTNKDCYILFRMETSSLRQGERDPMAFGIVLHDSGSMRGDIENLHGCFFVVLE